VVSTRRRFASRAEATENRKISCPEIGELMVDLSDAEREIAWVEIEQAMDEFEGRNGLEVPGEMLIGVGAK
jgi:hypothetical protein